MRLLLAVALALFSSGAASAVLSPRPIRIYQPATFSKRPTILSCLGVAVKTNLPAIKLWEGGRGASGDVVPAEPSVGGVVPRLLPAPQKGGGGTRRFIRSVRKPVAVAGGVSVLVALADTLSPHSGNFPALPYFLGCSIGVFASLTPFLMAYLFLRRRR